MNDRHSTVFVPLLTLIAFALAVGLPAPVQAQQSGITVTIPEVNPDPGTTVTLSIEADLGDNEVDSYTNMEFTFDSSALTIVDVRDGEELSFGTQNFVMNEEEDTLRVINVADNPPVSGSGEFLEIDVQLTQDTGIPFELTPSNTEATVPTSIFERDGEQLPVEVIDQGHVGLASIQEARQQGVNAAVAIQGTVTRAFGGYVRLQDESGPTGASAVTVRQTADNRLATSFRDDLSNGTITQGTRLTVAGTLSESAGLLRINNEDLSDYTVEEQGVPPTAQVVSLSDIQGPDGENYESELLRVEGLSFPNRDQTDGTFEANSTYTVENQSGTTFPFRVQDNSETELIGATIPTGSFIYEGVLGQDNGSGGNDEGYRLIPVRTSTALPVELADFDAVRSGSSVELTWQTASETNNAGFRVQHQSAEGWQELGFVESKAVNGSTTEAQSYRFAVDRDLSAGTHRFRLQQVDLDGSTSLSDVVSVDMQIDGVLTLNPPVPNPASGQATVSFAVTEATEAKVLVYNVLGQRVKTLYDGTPRAGQAKTLTVDASNLPSGIYVMQLQAHGQTRSQRLTVVR